MKKENSKKTIIFSILLTIDFVIGIIGYYKMNFINCPLCQGHFELV